METVEKKVFRSYYYDFESTGVECVDKILCWLARAGKAYHHTESWSEEQAENDSPDSFIGVIQKSADSAASRLTAVEVRLKDAEELLERAEFRLGEAYGYGVNTGDDNAVRWQSAVRLIQDDVRAFLAGRKSETLGTEEKTE